MKTVTMTNEQLLEVNRGLNLIAEIEPPPHIRIKIARIGRVIRPEAELIVDGRKSILDKFAIFDGEADSPNRRYKLVVGTDGQPIPNTVQLTDKAAFAKAEKDFYNETVSVIIPVLTLEDLEQIKMSNAAQELLIPICEIEDRPTAK